MLDCRNIEKIGQRWMKRAREMCISICLHFICLSISLSLCLSSRTHAVHEFLFRSLVLMEFRERVRERVKKIKWAKLYCCDPLLQWDVFCQPASCKTTHTITTQTHSSKTHMHLLHLTGWKSVMIAFFLKRGQILHVKMCPWITCCTANCFYSPHQVREIKGVKGAWGANRGRWGRDCFVLSAETLFYGCSVYNFAAVLCVCVQISACVFVFSIGQIWPYLSTGMN